jgi:CubicO group peptidase (beta-lactamase class C family)
VATSFAVTLPRWAESADAEIAAQLAALMDERCRDGGFSGSVLVARDGRPLLRQGYGMANLEHGVPNTPETKFRLGSVTKQFTAAAVLLLEEQGKLNVQAPVKTYLADSPAAWDQITLHHLLTHTSGIPDYVRFPLSPAARRESTTPDALIARFRDRPLDFAPGTRFAYSNSGYAVLGRVIEKVSGKPYAEFLRTSIFTPLAMNDSGYDDPRPVLAHRAQGYVRNLDGTVNAPYVDMSNPYAAGGLYSTVDDLLKWDRALAGAQLLKKESLSAMFTPFLQGYGYGWRIARTFDRPMVAHPGSIPGFSSHIRRYPEDGVCIIVLCNVEFAPAVDVGNDLAAIVFGKRPERPGGP